MSANEMSCSAQALANTIVPPTRLKSALLARPLMATQATNGAQR